jgi:hypothetical protein
MFPSSWLCTCGFGRTPLLLSFIQWLSIILFNYGAIAKIIICILGNTFLFVCFLWIDLRSSCRKHGHFIQKSPSSYHISVACVVGTSVNRVTQFFFSFQHHFYNWIEFSIQIFIQNSITPKPYILKIPIYLH